jgi:hypothetical protein
MGNEHPRVPLSTAYALQHELFQSQKKMLGKWLQIVIRKALIFIDSFP